MDDQTLDRFARQILLPSWGVEGQQALATKRVLVVGCGGLGSWTAHLLARAGVGEVHLADPDCIELSNLHRQLYSSSQVGAFKAQALAEDLAEFTCTQAYPLAVDASWLAEHGGQFDLWVDASDRWDIRMQLSAASTQQGVPWIYGSAIALSGQCAAFDPTQTDSACYHCLFGHQQDPGHSCEASGVLGPVVSTVSTTQSQWALAYLSGMAALPVGRLRRWEGALLDPLELQFKKNASCHC